MAVMLVDHFTQTRPVGITESIQASQNTTAAKIKQHIGKSRAATQGIDEISHPIQKKISAQNER